MDWSKEAITFGSGLLLGVMSGFVWPRLRDKISERKDHKAKTERKARILKDLDAISSDVMAAVQAEPHGVQNKDKWVSRLQQFATQYDDVLGPIAGYVKRISYKIEDSTFDHASLGNPPYCCDQVEEDMAFLKLCILPIVAKELDWDSGTIEKEEKRLLEKIWVNFQEISFAPLPLGTHAGMTDEELRQAYTGYDAEKAAEEYKAQQLNQWHAEWKAYKFRIGQGENLAMAPYVNHERKAVDQKL
jgi:hypothetical protein